MNHGFLSVAAQSAAIFERANEGLLNVLIAARQRQGRICVGSELDLLRDTGRIVDLDAEIADSAFELRMPEQQLHRS